MAAPQAQKGNMVPHRASLSALETATPSQSFLENALQQSKTESPTTRRKPRASIRSSRSGRDQLDSEFVVQEDPKKFFKTYKVFHVLWHQGAGEQGNGSIASNSSVSTGNFGANIHSKTRRMIVVAKMRRHCICVPITTYSGQGIGKAGVVPEHHVIVFSGETVPEPSNKENMAGKMLEPAIQVRVDNPLDKLDPNSRINFSELHTVHTNLRVKPYGRIDDKSHRPFDNLLSSMISSEIFSRFHPRLALLPVSSNPNEDLAETRPERGRKQKGKGRAFGPVEELTFAGAAKPGAEITFVEDVVVSPTTKRM